MNPRTLASRKTPTSPTLLSVFEGKLTTSRWAALTGCSQDTALRDIDDLIKRGVLAKDAGGGRSTSYALVLA